MEMFGPCPSADVLLRCPAPVIRLMLSPGGCNSVSVTVLSRHIQDGTSFNLCLVVAGLTRPSPGRTSMRHRLLSSSG